MSATPITARVVYYKGRDPAFAMEILAQLQRIQRLYLIVELGDEAAEEISRALQCAAPVLEELAID